jgi:hypothetical protein
MYPSQYTLFAKSRLIKLGLLSFGFATFASSLPAAVTASIAASRVSGVAPLAVHFDASATTSTVTARPFHECHYSWDFGDAGSGAWSTNGKSRNEDASPISGHVFDTPGNYTVTLTVRDSSGATDTETVNITVSDPDTVFSGTNTICISTDADFTGAPAGALQVTTSSWATASGYLGTGKRVLLKRGHTWDIPSGTKSMTFAGPGILGAFGNGAKPVLRFTSVTGNAFHLGSGGTPGQFADFRFMDLEVDGDGYQRRVFQAEGTVQNITFLRLDVHDSSNFIQMSNSTLEYYNTNGQPGHTVHSGVAIVDTTFDHLIGNGSGQNVAYMAQQKFTFLGNDWNDSMLGEHILRMPVCKRAIIAHSRFTNAPGIRHLVKIHAPPAAGATYLPSGEWMSDRIVIADNYFSSVENDWLVSVAPQNGTSDERVTDAILERNETVLGTETILAFHLALSQSTIRNNTFILSAYAAGGQAVGIDRRGIEPVPTNNSIYNNSAFHASSAFTFAGVNANAVDTTVRNNLIKGSGSPTMISGGGTNLQQSNNLSTATPGWVAATPATATDFELALGSAAIDAGTTVPVFEDYENAPRPVGSWDIGAFEFLGDGILPIAHWKFDETSGTTAADSSGGGNPGTISGAVPTTGQDAGAFDFDGVDDVVNVGSAAIFDNPAALTVSAWIRPDNTGEGGYGRIVQKGNGTNGAAGYRFTMAGTNQLEFVVDYATTDLTRRSVVNSLTMSTWQHVAVTWDGSASASNVKIYVNGVEVSSYATTTSGVGARGDDSATDLRIGNNDLGSRTFNGVIDDVKFYDQVLSASDL